MWAALTLRVLEARRRGGLLLVGLAVLAVAATAAWGGETPDGRYGLASDLAATVGYLLAILFGTVPMASDRERRRAYLPAASPVTPVGWALGNALGAAVVAGAATLVLFAGAGAGTAASGGIETRAVTGRVGDRGTIWDPFPKNGIVVAEGSRLLRLVTRSVFSKEDAVGSAFAPEIEVGGRRVVAHPERPLLVPIDSERVLIRNLSPDFRVGLVTREIRSLGEDRSFLANAALGGVGPALGAAALAALAAAAGANLSASVAALAMTLVLLLSGMKGFLHDVVDFEGGLRAERAHTHGDAAGGAGPRLDARGGGAASAAARVVVRGVIRVLPDLNALDRSDLVATGEWTDIAGTGRAAAILATALAVAAGLGAVGVRLRRMP